MRIALAALGALLFGVILLFGSYVSAHNGANAHEQGIQASYKSSEVVLGQYRQKIEEMAQIPGMQTEDLANIITAANDARYGGDGVSGVMNWITEQNPTLDQSTYAQLQREIAAGRDAFQNSQNLVIDRVRAYSADLGTFWRGRMMKIAGFPKIDLDDYAIVSTAAANTAFETKIDAAPIKMR